MSFSTKKAMVEMNDFYEHLLGINRIMPCFLSQLEQLLASISTGSMLGTDRT